MYNLGSIVIVLNVKTIKLIENESVANKTNYRILVVVFLLYKFFDYFLFAGRLLIPLSTGIINFLQNATFFAGTVPSGRAGGTSTPIIRITEYAIVLDEVLWLMRVGIKMISGRFPIVADLMRIGITIRKKCQVASTQYFFPVRIRIGIVTQVNVDVKKVKRCL